MKRLITLVGLLLLGGTLLAQGPADALRIAQLNYEGSARTLAMGNAFTALGGDIGALTINPASSGVYRYSEMAVSLGYTNASMVSLSGDDMLNNSYSGRTGRVTLPNIGAIGNFDTGNSSGLFSISYGIAANRIGNFNRVTAGSCRTANSTLLGSLAAQADGWDQTVLAFDTDNGYNPYLDSSAPWSIIQAYDAYAISPLDGTTSSYIGTTENIDDVGTITVGGPIDQLYFNRCNGGITEFVMNVGANFSDKLYLGANLNLHMAEYSQTEYYSETPVNSDQFQDGPTFYATQFQLRTTGVGVNLKLGAIYNPIPGLRLGATITTPTLYSLTDVWNRATKTEFDNGQDYYRESPDGAYEYSLVTPFRWSLGAAYTGARGLISVDYENVNYGATRFDEKFGLASTFTTENNQISNGYTVSHLLRVGAEYWITNGIAGRLGYNLYTSPGKDVDADMNPVYTHPDTHFVSAGLGFLLNQDGDIALDIAYQRMLAQSDRFIVYDDYDTFTAPVYDGYHTADKVVVSLIFKF